MLEKSNSYVVFRGLDDILNFIQLIKESYYYIKEKCPVAKLLLIV